MYQTHTYIHTFRRGYFFHTFTLSITVEPNGSILPQIQRQRKRFYLPLSPDRVSRGVTGILHIYCSTWDYADESGFSPSGDDRNALSNYLLF